MISKLYIRALIKYDFALNKKNITKINNCKFH